MSVVILPETEYAKELAKWEQPGYRFRPYPKMLYKAFVRANGQIACMEGPPPSDAGLPAAEYDRRCVAAATFTTRCQRIVPDETAERVALNDGWSLTPQDAIAACEAREQAIGQAAAEAAHAARRMSPKAQAEFADAEAATARHVVDVRPRRKSHHKKKGRKPWRPVAPVAQPETPPETEPESP